MVRDPVTARGTKYWHSGVIPLIAPEMLGNIIADVGDLSIVIAEDGVILSVLVNPDQPGFQKLESWAGRDVRDALTVESVPKFEQRLHAFLTTPGPVKPVELNHTEELGHWEFPIRYTFHRIGPEGAVLMLGRDLRVVAEMQQQLVRAQLTLERDYETQREFETRFRVLMESAPDPVVFLAVQTGRITEVNSAATQLLGRSREDLIGSSFLSEFDSKTRPDLVETLTDRAAVERGGLVEVTLRRGGEVVGLAPTLFRSSGERLILCRVSRGSPAHEQHDPLTDYLRSLYKTGADAMVFTTLDGTILSANDGFLDLINAADDLVVGGRNLTDYLHRGAVDLKVMTENASRSGRMRLYPTKMVSEFGSPRTVEVAVSQFKAGEIQVFAFVIRDVSRMETVRPGAVSVSDDNVRSVMELVGSATLKEIVAETTDVVEKMCIETAVELTMNNRVAAAEMLGLSRQSLYVKLRKYNLLSKTGE